MEEVIVEVFEEIPKQSEEYLVEFPAKFPAGVFKSKIHPGKMPTKFWEELTGELSEEFPKGSSWECSNNFTKKKIRKILHYTFEQIYRHSFEKKNP